MTLTRRPSPFGELVTLRQAMNRLVGATVFGPPGDCAAYPVAKD
jgi:hypothetical protein